jgi:hypothetical protein
LQYEIHTQGRIPEKPRLSQMKVGDLQAIERAAGPAENIHVDALYDDCRSMKESLSPTYEKPAICESRKWQEVFCSASRHCPYQFV